MMQTAITSNRSISGSTMMLFSMFLMTLIVVNPSCYCQEVSIKHTSSIRGRILKEDEGDAYIGFEKDAVTPKNSGNGLWALVHIGPSLTGISAIQASIKIIETQLLTQDRFEDAISHALSPKIDGIDERNVVGCFRHDAVAFNQSKMSLLLKDESTFGQRSISSSTSSSTSSNRYHHRQLEVSCHPDVMRLLKEASSDRRHNLILSSDYLADPRTDLPKLQNFLTAGWENHKVVAYYRRYYDWLLSYYENMYKHSSDNNPETRKPISDFIEEEFDHQYLYKTKYVTEAIDRYRVYFPFVEVINMYEVEDVRTAFYCNALIGGTITGACQEFKRYYNSNIEQERSNMKKHFYHHESKRTAENRANYVYSDLVYYAKKRGLLKNINSQLATEQAITATKHHQEQTLGKSSIDFMHSTIICPRSKQTNWILAKSKAVEETLFPEYYNRKGKDEIEQHFEHIKRSFHLCHIDAEAVLDLQPEWTTFFEQLDTNINNNNNIKRH